MYCFYFWTISIMENKNVCNIDIMLSHVVCLVCLVCLVCFLPTPIYFPFHKYISKSFFTLTYYWSPPSSDSVYESYSFWRLLSYIHTYYILHCVLWFCLRFKNEHMREQLYPSTNNFLCTLKIISSFFFKKRFIHHIFCL